MSDELVGFVGLILGAVLLGLLLSIAFDFGTTVENTRLYRKCLVEQQDRTHKEAVELCKERTKE